MQYVDEGWRQIVDIVVVTRLLYQHACSIDWEHTTVDSFRYIRVGEDMPAVIENTKGETSDFVEPFLKKTQHLVSLAVYSALELLLCMMSMSHCLSVPFGSVLLYMDVYSYHPVLKSLII